MILKLMRRRWLLALGVGLLFVMLVAVAFALSTDEESSLVVYNGRSHYGDEDVFRDFERETGIEVVLRGGTAPELFERLRREGEQTPADVLITTDLANLWRAKESGLLQGVSTAALRRHVPARLHDPEGAWWALTTRVRTPVVSTERVPEGAVTDYADLGDPRWKGRTCLRTSASEYNQSLVADMIAKRGPEATERLLRSWMANDPEILGSDGELLAVIAGGDCDVGLSNHYYLGRALHDDPDFPVRPAWPDQDGRGAHANLSGVGLVRWADHEEDALALMEYLTSREAQSEFTERSEFAANPEVPPAPHIRDWADVVTDPIDAEAAGPLLGEAVALMLEVGWD